MQPAALLRTLRTSMFTCDQGGLMSILVIGTLTCAAEMLGVGDELNVPCCQRSVDMHCTSSRSVQREQREARGRERERQGVAKLRPFNLRNPRHTQVSRVTQFSCPTSEAGPLEGSLLRCTTIPLSHLLMKCALPLMSYRLGGSPFQSRICRHPNNARQQGLCERTIHN